MTKMRGSVHNRFQTGFRGFGAFIRQFLSINKQYRAFAPVIVSRLADYHHPTHQGKKVVGRPRFQEVKIYLICFATKTVFPRTNMGGGNAFVRKQISIGFVRMFFVA